MKKTMNYMNSLNLKKRKVNCSEVIDLKLKKKKKKIIRY